TATFPGTGGWLASSGDNAVAPQVANQAATTTTLAASVNPTAFGQSVTFSATVTSGAASPTGLVTFMDGALALGTGSIGPGGIATFTTSNLAVGSHSTTAVYAGDPNFSGSMSAALTQTVNKASTTTNLTSSLNPSKTGQAVTFTATVAAVAPGGGIPGGTVTFMEKNVVLAVANVDP